MKITRFVGLLTLLLSTMVLAQTNPVPLINNPLVPASIAPGGPGFTLTVNGTGFVSTSVVNWNGSPRSTAFISSSQLTASITSFDIGVVSTATITVANPGAVASNPMFFTVTSARTIVSFSTTSLTVGTNPDVAATGDFNHDGKLDLAIPNSGSSTVSILLGNGDGTFHPHANFTTGNAPVQITIGDFSGDGNSDLAVVCAGNEAISVLLGNGDGTFRTHVDYQLPAQSFSVLTADLNGDGKLDLAAAYNAGVGAVAIFLGNGNGTFQNHQDFPAGSSALLLTSVGDFNKDGKLDLALTTQAGNTVSLLLGDGDGTFQAPTQFPTAAFPSGAAAGDFNSDGNLDLAVASIYTNSLSVLLGNGDGSFQPHVDYPVAFPPSSPVATDINGDNKLDLIVTTGNSSPFLSVSILLGNGDGTFQTEIDLVGGDNAFGVVAADFNNDGMLDLTASDNSTNVVSLLLQDAGTVVTLSPTSLTFSTQLVGTISPPRNVSLTNTGASAINIGRIATTTNFSQTNNCGSSLAAGATCTIIVYLTPTAPGPLTGFLSVTDSGGGSPQLATLSGTGTVVKLSATTLNFGNQAVGTTSAPLRVTLTNTGSTKLKINHIGLTGNNPGDFAEVNACGTSLAAGQKCQIQVTFTPTLTGPRIAKLAISDNGGGSPQTVKLTGTGT